MVCTLSFGEIINIHDGLHIRLASALLTIANGFNDFLVNVAPNLAKKIKTVKGKSIYDYIYT